MIYIYYTFESHPCYFFTTPEWFSSDFDSLEQLMEVGLDDPDKVELAHLHYHGKRYTQDLHSVTDLYDDCQLLVKVESFEDLESYPELFI